MDPEVFQNRCSEAGVLCIYGLAGDHKFVVNV